MLLEHQQADKLLQQVDNIKQTALHIALTSNRLEIIKVLLEKGMFFDRCYGGYDQISFML